jgi:hypothetical protein
MNTKEKALEIFNKFYEVDITIIGIESQFEERGLGVDDSKKLSLICADMLIEETDWTEVRYWQEVKEEIKKL